VLPSNTTGMPGDGPTWLRRASAIGLVSLVFFETAALGGPSMVLVSSGHHQLNVGAFSYSSTFGLKSLGVRKGGCPVGLDVAGHPCTVVEPTFALMLGALSHIASHGSVIVAQ
jgi:hypothetical protein